MISTIRLFIARLFQYRADYQYTSGFFLRLLALVYFIAFLSLSVQITGLVGPHGILPFNEVLVHSYQSAGWKFWVSLPNIFWLGASDPALLVVSCAGAGISLLLFFGIAEQLATIVLFVFYLSLYHAGQIFLSFQWDSLLLESGFIAIFLVSGPTSIVLLMFEWLLFRFRFMSGVSKLVSGDPSWTHFSALDYYFQTQPLPHIGSWYASHLPQWIHQFGVGFTFFTELLVPLMIFMPRPFRIAAALITILMQLLIIATSNHAFVNVLVMVLCVLLLDDKIVRRFVPDFLCMPIDKDKSSSGAIKGGICAAFALCIVFTSSSSFYMYASNNTLPEAVIKFDTVVQQWGIGQIYHIFPTMQRERQELIIQGSRDGKLWKDYQFNYKPGPLNKKPAFIVPYHPRLDWMLWFVPIQSQRQMYWFRHFEQQLRKGSPQVLSLLHNNPFPDKPPRFIRVKVYDYQFTSSDELKRTGHWWKRTYLGIYPYVPPRHP